MSLAVCSVQAAKTLNDLTLEEKIGQMMQLVTDLFGTNDAQGVFHIDRAKADTLFSKYKIGSILNAPNTCAPTAKQWEEIIADIQQLSMKRPESRLDLHAGWYAVSAEHQRGGYLQPRYCPQEC